MTKAMRLLYSGASVAVADEVKRKLFCSGLVFGLLGYYIELTFLYILYIIYEVIYNPCSEIYDIKYSDLYIINFNF